MGLVQSDHISSQEDQIMIKQTEHYHHHAHQSRITEDVESNGHSPMANIHQMGQSSGAQNPLNTSAMQEF